MLEFEKLRKVNTSQGIRKPVYMGGLESSKRKIQESFCYRKDGKRLREAGRESSGAKFLPAMGWGWTEQVRSVLTSVVLSLSRVSD